MTKNTVRVEGDLPIFFKKLASAIKGLDSIDGNTLVEEGQLTDSNIPVKETLLSENNKEALAEYEYLKTRKEGGAISSEEESKLERLERDILKSKSKGFIYGS